MSKRVGAVDELDEHKSKIYAEEYKDSTRIRVGKDLLEAELGGRHPKRERRSATVRGREQLLFLFDVAEEDVADDHCEIYNDGEKVEVRVIGGDVEERGQNQKRASCNH